MKDEELWNKILLVVQAEDIVRFKYGKVDWTVLYIGQLSNGKQYLKLRRQRYLTAHSMYREGVYKTVFQGTPEYRKIRIVKPHE